ncbi:MAG TPA: hypothetical protein VHY09_07895, partial [Candidatus Methylacidiphilales bacterium]|nr:hypothetical protein [Candidatus Methylacidiphilales bacterium]
AITLNGKLWPLGLRKIPWSALKGKVRLGLVRGEKAPAHPVIVRADGLRVNLLKAGPGQLAARLGGSITGEVAIQTSAKARVLVEGKPVKTRYDRATRTTIVPFANRGDVKLEVFE